MNVQVVYYTQTGNTRKLADAIGEELSCPVSTMSENIDTNIDLLFLGSSMYNFGLDKQVINFIDDLDPAKIKAVALFSTSWMVKSGNSKMAELLRKKGINVLDKEFYCKGEFLKMNKNRPNNDDVLDIQKFARDVLHEVN